MRRRHNLLLFTAFLLYSLSAVVLCFGQHVAETQLVPVASNFVAKETQTRLVPGGGWQTVHGDYSVMQSLPRYDDGSFWKWSPSGQHHNAAVKVRGVDGSGSGICIASQNGVCLVLTNHHVVAPGRTVTIQWQNGGSAKGAVAAVLTRDFEDVALIHVPDPAQGWIGLPLATQEPPVGATLEMVGFGGPRYGTKRSFFGVRLRGDGRKAAIRFGAPTISGDSGSGILWQNQIVGINWGGYGRPTHYRGVGLIYPACSGVSPSKLSAWVRAQCGPGGYCAPGGPCGPGGAQPIYGIPGGGSGGGGFYNPPTQPPIPQPPSIAEPTQPQAPTQPSDRYVILQPADIERIKAEIIAEMPKPKDGVDGKDGKDGRDGQDATISQSQMAGIVAAVLAQQPQQSADPTPEQMAKIIASLPPIYLRKIGPDGEQSVEQIYLGEGMTFRMFPHEDQHK